MPTTNFTNVQQEGLLWNSSELTTPEDLNNAQRLGRRAMLDHLMRPLFIEPGSTLDTASFGGVPQGQVSARPIGASFVLMQQQTPGTMNVIVKRGSLLWLPIADPGQPEPQQLLHCMDTDITVAVDAADPVNGRIDILSYKVELISGASETRISKDASGNITSPTFSKRRQTQLTVTYTPGVASGSPAAPATPAGHVKFHEIEVSATETSLDSTNFVDFRTPAGFTQVTVNRSLAKSIASWTEGINEWTVAAGSAELRVGCPVSATGISRIGSNTTSPLDIWSNCFANLRLALIRIACRIDKPTGSVTLWRGTHQYVDAATQVMDLSPDISDAAAGLFTSKLTTTTAPIWSNGYRSPHVSSILATAQTNELILRIISGGASDTFRGATFYFWGI